MNEKQCAKLLSREFPLAKQVYDNHIIENGILNSHMFFGEINQRFMEEFKTDTTNAEAYFGFVEKMWKEGDDRVQLILRHTVIEHLTDEPDIWQLFGQLISPEFKDFINNELLNHSEVWQQVTPLQ